MNPYFKIEEQIDIKDVDDLLSLNVEKTYYRSGYSKVINNFLDMYSFPYSTAGIFRGQLFDFPLIPKCFRHIKEFDKEKTPYKRTKHWVEATLSFRRFCERAEIQNPSFPENISDRMSIAQHFAVSTPLLDWTKNILAAVFFAIRDVYADEEFEKTQKVFIYHIIDERLLHIGIPDESKLKDFDFSAYIKPYPIDRRIERQQGVFTYHPYPTDELPIVPVKKYVLEFQILLKLIQLMKGFGFTEDYYFPDYAGIARAVMSETSL